MTVDDKERKKGMGPRMGPCRMPEGRLDGFVVSFQIPDKRTKKARKLLIILLYFFKLLFIIVY